MDSSNSTGNATRTNANPGFASWTDSSRSVAPQLPHGYSIWMDEWVRSEKNGEQAKAKILAWVKKGDSGAVLNLSGLELKTAPPLPLNVQKLKIDSNHLTTIPENYFSGSLTALDVHCNQLTQLPETLPTANLCLLNAANNKIGSLPPCARALAPECKIYLLGNPLSEALLCDLFGPALNEKGLRQLSCSRKTSQSIETGDGIIRDSKATMLAPFLSTAEMGEEINIEPLASALKDVDAFCRFLNLIRASLAYQDPAFRKSLAQLINRIASSPELCARASDLVAAIKPLQEWEEDVTHYQAAFVFHELQLLVIDRDITAGLYAGRVADVVLHLRKKYRTVTAQMLAAGKRMPGANQWMEWTKVAGAYVLVNIGRDIGLPFQSFKSQRSGRHMAVRDPMAVMCMPNIIKSMENKGFAEWLVSHESTVAPLLGHADPQITAIMSCNTDKNGKQLGGSALAAMHLNDLRAYFFSQNYPDPTSPYWQVDTSNVNLSGSTANPNDSCNTH